MANLPSFFADIVGNKVDYVGVPNGNELEQRIMNGLLRAGFNRILERDIGVHAATIRPLVRDHFHAADLLNPTKYQSHYWYQPTGSQNYHDFVIFLDDRLLCIEAKFSKGSQKKPVWNSGLPRQHGIYIFGSRGAGDVTFFMGKDVITEESAKQMHGLFVSMQKHQKDFNEGLERQPYGFAVYVRKAFEQTKKGNPDAVLNFFTNPDRESLEQSVIDFVT